MIRPLISIPATILLGLGSVSAQANEVAGGPVAIISCPANGKMTQTIDLSTGAVPWIAEGQDLPISGKALATPIDAMQIPAGWAARLDGAQWVQALPENTLTPHAPGSYIFSIQFTVKTQRRMPKLSLAGSVIADENFDLTLIEPSATNQSISSGIAYGDDTPGEIDQADVQPLKLTKSGDQSGKPLGHRAGIYRLQIAVENGAAPNAALGLLAHVRLIVGCANGK